MNSLFSHALTFIGGVLAKWFQGVLHDRKSEWKTLAEQILRPMREQVHNAIPELEAGERVTTVDLAQWNRLVASGRDRDLPEDLRTALGRFYTIELPAHDRAWLAANDEVPRVMELADENFGGKRAGADLPLAPWRRFLTGDSPDLDVVGWHSGPIRIWNRQLELIKLLPLHGSKENLLNHIWTEGQMRPSISLYRPVRISCLDHATRCLIMLDSALDGSWLTRISKRLRNVPV